MQFGILGALEVRSASGEVPIRRGLPRTILIALLLRRGQPVASDFLVDLLWPDEPPRNPAHGLQTQVSYLRKTLGAAGPTPLETRPGGYALLVEPAQIDAHRFEAAVKAFAPLDALTCRAALRQALDDAEDALALWRGDPLEDVGGMDFARGETARLDELRWAAIERRLDLQLLLGRHGEAIGDLSEWVQKMPLRERFHEQLVLALYRSGRQADALRAYTDARRTLVEELGIEPGAELRELERRVLQQDPTLDWMPPDERADGIGDTGDIVEPAGSARRNPGRLPVPVTPLIGRDAQLSRVEQQMGGHRLVTLTGPAGAGKTRLAIEVAARNPEPVCYVDFSPIDDPGLVAATVAAAAGVTIKPGDDPVDAITDTLASRDLLLVLDTCEHVVGAVAQLVSATLAAAAGVRVLATSRRALGIPGEFAWPVPPLDVPPPDATTAEQITSHAAVALFIERANSVWPDLAIDDTVAADIAAVCVALDGLPLAIELAAARTDVLSPAAIRTRLQDRFGLLVDGGVAVTERQQTLRAAIDWSFELLSADQRRFFARLGVFAGTFDLDAALTVAGEGSDTPLELLASLVKQSMVARGGNDRYRLLDTLRAYALEVLADLDADETRNRHAGYYVQRAEQGELAIRGPNQLDHLDRFRTDLNNFRAALDWCLSTGDTTSAARQAGALAWFWTLNGMLTEAIQHLERLIEIDDVPPPTRAKCLWGYALLASSLGRLETARAAAYRAVSVAGQSDTAGAAYGLNAAAVAEWALGNHDRSLDAHRQAIALLDRLDDPWGLAVCHVLQARTLFDLGDDTAAAVARIGVEHARRAGDRHVLGIGLTQLAQIAIAGNDTAAAISAASEAVALQERIGYTEGIVSALHVLGHAYRASGDMHVARQHHQRALGLAARIGHAAAMCEAVEDLARDELTDRPAVAAALLRAARTERARRQLPLRQRDSQQLGQLEQALTALGEHGPDERTFSELVAEMTAVA